nr:DUF4249 domain-containing protein [Allomuricauda sp.]
MSGVKFNISPLTALRISLLILIGVSTAGCIESFVPETDTFEDVLVIEATLTDELKPQEIILSRAFRFEEFVPEPERNATVVVMENSSSQYIFEETLPGTYHSTTNFAILPGNTYQLMVSTSDGRQYESSSVVGPEPAPIQGLTAAISEDPEAEGMEILVEYDNTQASSYFRYKYEETYKIIAPDWSGQRLEYQGPQLVVMPLPVGREERTCFSTVLSDEIILNSPRSSNSGNILGFPVRFIERDNFIISHRYSILVKQLAISEESYSYLETLESSTAGDDLLSPSQPGFFNGNVSSTTNTDEKVLGFFHVASVTSERIFFNYEDFYPNEELPPYVENCLPFIPPLESVGGELSIHQLLGNNTVKYHSTTVFGEFVVVARACADCTALGDPNVPDFWEE